MRKTTIGFLHFCDEIGVAVNTKENWIGAFEKLLKDTGKQTTLDEYFAFLNQLQTADEIVNELDSISDLARSSQDKNVQDAVVMVDGYVRSAIACQASSFIFKKDAERRIAEIRKQYKPDRTNAISAERMSKNADPINKRYLKEDGSVDIDYIDSLTSDEQMKVYRDMTFDELVFYIINGQDDGVRVWKDNESLDDMLKRGCVLADDFMAKLRRKINQK